MTSNNYYYILVERDLYNKCNYIGIHSNKFYMYYYNYSDFKFERMLHSFIKYSTMYIYDKS